MNPAFLILLIGLFALFGSWTVNDLVAASDANLQLTKTIEGDLTEVESGAEFTYILAYNCASALVDCDGATIVDPLPPELEYLSLTTNPAHIQSANYNGGTREVTFTFVDPLPAGSTGILKISVRFAPGTLPGTVASNQATFDATNATAVTTAPIIISATGQFEMFARKTLDSDPVIGFPLTFTLEICSPDTIGGVNLINPTFTDQLPPNATFVTAQGTDGIDWIYDAGLDTVTFINLPDVTVAGGCLSRTVTLTYNSDPGSPETNTLNIIGTPEGCDGSISPLPGYCNGITGSIGIGPVGVTYTLVDPYADISGGKSSIAASTFNGQSGELSGTATTEALLGEAITYTVSAQNTGYITVTNATVTDTIPAELILTGFTLAPAQDGQTSGFYELDSSPGVWQPLPANPYNAPTTIDVSTLGLGGATITALRWDLGTLSPLSASWSANVFGTIDPSQTAGTSFQNCTRFTADSTDGPQLVDNCDTVNIIAPRSVPRIQKSNDDGPYVPGQEVDFFITLRNDAVAQLDYNDPILSDLLPSAFELITSTIVLTTPVGAPAPAPTISNDYLIPGQTLLVWRWEGADSYSLPPGEEIQVQFTVRIVDFTPPGTYFNTATVTSNSPNPDVYDCTGQPTNYQDVNDMDGDADFAEYLCRNPNNDGFVEVGVALSMDSEKFVRGARDDHFQKLGLTYPGGEIDWKVVITNISNVTTTNIIIYDILPYIGDTGVIATSENRDSQWRPNMMGPIEAPVGIPLTISYSQSTNPCRPEVVAAAGCVDDWTTTFPLDPTSVQAIRLDFCDAGGCLELPIGDAVEFSWPMVAPNDAPTDVSCEQNLDPYDPPNHQVWAADNPACEIAWNSFGFSAQGGGLTLLPAEPIRVGIAAAEQPVTGFSLGDFVWLDVAGVENDAIQQIAEQSQWGVNGVRVELRYPDGSMVDLNSDGNVDFRYTGPHFDGRPGYYLFGNLPADDYVVRFFPPAGYTTSAPNIGGDDALDSDGETTGIDPTYGNYLQSATITLASDDFNWDQGLWLAADYGDLPWDGVNFTYPITTTGAISPELAARHIIVPDLYLGNSVDAELDGQPTVGADGDDNNGAPDDEDGIVFTTPIIAGEQACLTVTAVTTQTQSANLSAWFDFDGDGTLNGATEQVFADVQPNSGTDLGGNEYELCFTVPATTGYGGTLYSRFRLSTDVGLTPEGTANDGEVEDYRLELATVGNYVWFDDPITPGVYNDVQDPTEFGIPNVPVDLIWGGPDGVIGTGGDDVTYSSITDASGEYHFSGLLTGSDEYQIEITQNPGIPAVADQGGDDALDSDGDNTGAGPVFTIPSIPIGTNDNAPNDTPGYESYDDNHDDLSFDFGFYEAVAIGNLVWRDNGAGLGAPDNGYLSGTETGINNVTVELYNSGDTPGVDVPVATTNTAGGGLYQFDYLLPGQYFVHIQAAEFDVAGGGTLREYISSTGSGIDETIDHDVDENGIDDVNWKANGISSLVYDLQPNAQRTGESQSNYAGYLDDDNVNFTADFGFHRPVAIGNIVWIDDGSGGGIINNGILDGTEAGVANVTVELYNRNDTPGVDTPVAITTTDPSGYYVFDTVTRGRYFVHIPAAEFSGGDLVGYLSSAGAGGDDAIDETGDENGVDDVAMLTNGISSQDYNLQPDNEPTSDDESLYTGVWDDNNVNFTADFSFVEAVAIGNIVWNDNGAGTANNGIQDAGELGIAGVTVELYAVGDNPSSDTPIATDTTDGNGFYEFDRLYPGNYFIHIPAVEFGTGGDLEDYVSSTGNGSDETSDQNADENGIDNSDPTANGISSTPYDLQPNSETTADDESSYTGSLDDDNVNFTADFGFYEAVAIGNIVWNDNGAGAGTSDNGIMDGSELGIDGVTVELYASGDTPGVDTPIATDTTSGGGFYEFDSLLPGSYFTHIPAAEFGASATLENFVSSTGNGNDETTDQTGDENGIDNATPATNGISSTIYDLQPSLEVTGEGESNYTGYLSDNHVNFSADFGFYQPVAIGNIVWIDDGAGAGGVINNGIMDGTEAGIDNITVELYADGDTAGVSTPVGTTTTAGGGLYLFDDLAPGGYFIYILAAEFSTDLAGYLSSNGNGSSETADQDTDENGIDDAAMVTNGISSIVYDLQADNAPTGETPDNYTGKWDDDNVNLSADFGFVEAVAIGNIVWNDNGAGTANNGIQDAGELGIVNVTVELFAVGDNPSSDTPIATDVTDGNGRYEFDRLYPGNYFVHIPALEFGSGGDLEDYVSSAGNGSDETSDQNVDENGIDSSNAPTNGISSTAYDLQPNSETTTDDETGYGGSLDDDNVNFTADFGFYQAVAIGNIVWNDNGIGSGGISDNGIMDGSELGIDGVTVQLYDSGDTLIATTTTSGGGFYEFDNLLPGQYYVHIPASQFAVSAILEYYVSSTGNGTDETVDQGVDENGIDDANRTINGISTPLYTLALGSMVTGEGQSNYSGYLSDSYVNFTADFGFYQPVAIGNIVWIDDGVGVGGVINNGIKDGTEAGVDNITVELYDGGGLVDTTTTAGGGFYMFDELAPGSYYVHIPAAEFSGGDLVGYLSSTGNGSDETTDDTGDENGIDDSNPVANGISSTTYILQQNSEATGEGQSNYTGRLDDDNVNFTADFGFVEMVAIGNIVWNDNGAGTANNGIQDAGELGIAGVTVELFAVGDNPSSDTPIATDVTDGNGRYEFDSLYPGNYFVHIPAAEFGTGGDLEDYVSSTGNGSDETSDQDADENGIDNSDPATNGISSTAYDLQPNSETITDDETGYSGSLDDDNVNFTADFGFYEAVAIGNIIWNDNGAGVGISDNGILDGSEAGIDNVTVELYANGDTAGVDTPVATTTTSGGGFYEFDALFPGQYFVHIPASEFGTGGDLEDFTSSTGNGSDETTDQDGDENGIDEAALATNGISSSTYTLQAGSELTGEGQSNYSGYLSDNHVNFTADFSFHQLVAIGNIVWNDNGAGVGTLNNGIIDGSEAGIDNVAVELYDVGDTPGVDTPVATTTTSGGGFYEFDNLSPGQYFVHIPAAEFGTGGDLDDYVSTTGNGSDETSDQDADENGIDDAAPASNGISSTAYDLQPNSELTGEDQGNYSGSLDDNHVNFTADFGFFEAVALGNIIWDDNGAGGGISDNGIMDGSEAGIDNVTVDLYLDGDTPGVDTPVATTTTSGGGFYEFDNLPPGAYFIHIPASEFGSGGDLEDFVSSTGNGTDETSDQDADENGIDDADLATNGIQSPRYNLQPNSERLGEDQSSYSGSLDDHNVNFTADMSFYQPVAIGNMVWHDNGAGAGTANNGIIDGTEAGLDNVSVELYANGDTPGVSTPISTTTTSGGGFYAFDNLAPGEYFTHIPAAEFGTGGDLDDYVSSTGNGTDETSDQDADENGIDDADPISNGISSTVYDLQANSETTTDDETSYGGVLDDDNVNFTADFGFYEAVAIGNIVWHDNGAGVGTANNGIMDGTEAGIDGVSVELYADGDTPGVSTPITTTTTAGGGFYEFDNLPPGQYFIHIPASEFGGAEELVGFASSTSNGADETSDQDADENGIDDSSRASNGISSPTYTLQPNSEVTSEASGSYGGTLDDDNVNFTADFGFYEAVAIGNIIWDDNGAGGGTSDNGIMDGTEAGIDNVTVELYADGDTAGVDTPVATTTSSGGGLYEFDNLLPGQYFVHIPASEFTVGGDLEEYISTTGNGTDEINDQDADENGIDDATPSTNGISSIVYDLQPDGETAVDDESSYSGSLDDDNVNFTADFSFYQPVAIGNIVWHDNGAGLGTLGNGIMDGTEAGIDNVTVELYAVGDTPGISTPISTTMTVGGGFYAFDMLPPGNYFVHIPASEFGVGGDLEDYVSSTGNGTDETSDQDADENGIDDLNPASNGISSSPYDLQPNSETTADDESSYGGSLDDDNVNFTADFGFVALAGIGDTVWLDTNEDGIQNVGEIGIVGVTVNLYDSGNTLISTTTTITNGLYTFIDLQPGDYYVEFVIPVGYIISPQNSGSDPVVDSDVDPVTNRTVTTTLDAGEYDPTWDAGLYIANPEITIVKGVSVASTVPNQTAVLTYTLSVTNTGNVVLNSVNVTDTLPVGLTFVPASATPAETGIVGQTLNWDDLTGGLDFNPGDNLQIVFEATLTNTIGTYINETGVIATVPPGNNYPGGTVDDIDDIPVIVADPSVALNKEMVAPGIVDGVITYTIRITNTGPSMIDVLPLFDTFTGPIEYIGGTPAADSVDNVGGTLVWNDLTTSFGDLAPGQVITIVTAFQITSIDTEVTIVNSVQVQNGLDLFNNSTNEPSDTVTLVNIPTAVELTSFTTSSIGEKQVRVNWTTASEIDNFGFRVYRSQINDFSGATEVHFEPSTVPGGSGTGASYQYVDTVSNYGTWYYWLEDVETGGETAVHGSVSVVVSQLYQIFIPIIISP